MSKIYLTMKKLVYLSIFLLSFSMVVLPQAFETFDISTFTAPKGWAKQAGQNSIQFSKVDKENYCLITLFKSIPGLGEPKENFDAAWGTIVKEAVNVSAIPQMFPSDNKANWQFLGGFAPFEKDGMKGIVLLYTASGYGKMVNALILTNTQVYEPTITAFLESISLKAVAMVPAKPAAPALSESPILGTWGRNVGAHMTYADPVAASMAGYTKDQYTLNADGTYSFVSKTFRMDYAKILLVKESGTYSISGTTVVIAPKKSVIEAWSKNNGTDKWGRLLTSQERALEKTSYRFTKHYFSGIDQWQLILQADRPTERDGPYSTFTLFTDAWYYSPISVNNPVVDLPR